MFSARPRLRGLLTPTAVLFMLLVVVAGLTVLPPVAGPASAATTQVTEGHLDWGIKRSWRNYIGADNTTLSGGVTRNEDGTFRFPVSAGTFDDETNTTVISFAGSVRFQGYYEYVAPGKWALDSQWSDLELTISPTEQVLRGDYQGYPRDNPGGDLETLEHVVVAKLDVSTGESSFADGTSTWSDLFTVAGPGFTLYTEGTVIDPVSVSYEGPGGAPDLGEHWAAQGAPVLAEEERWVSANSGSTRNLSGFYYSERDRVVQVAEIRNAGMPSAVFTLSALDAETLQPVGQTLTKDSTTGGTKYARTAFDADTGTVFHVTGWEGAARLTTNVYASTWDPETSSYATVEVGQLPDSVVASNVVQVAGMVWNARDDELAVLVRVTGADPFSNYRLYRFSRSLGAWQREITALTLPSDGEYAGATGESNALGDIGTQQIDGPTMGVFRDGSYLVASSSGAFSFADGHRVYAEASHITVDEGGTATVRFIDGTRGSRASTGGTYYGFTSVAEGARDAAGGAPLALHNAGQSMDGLVQVDVVDGEAEVVAAVPAEVDSSPPSLASTFGRVVGTDQSHGYAWVADINDPQERNLRAYRDGAEITTMTYPEIRIIGRGYGGIQAAEDGSLYVGITDATTGRNGIALLAFKGITATVTGQPSSESVALGAGEESRAVTFTSTAAGGEPTASRQWQVKPVGTSSFGDLPGETGETLTVAVRPGMDGTQYRAVYTNAAGSLVSGVATLSVDFAPRLLTDARDQRVTEGADATFLADFEGFPEPTLTWQRRVDGFWTNIDPDDDNYVVSGASLTVTDTIPEQSGALFRVRSRNSVATAYSRAARLTVDSRSAIPAAGLDLSGVVLEWTGSEELQVAPPVGGSNYFSAGDSDGSQATYRATDGDVSIWQVGPGGARTPATYGARAAHVGTGGHQLVRLGAGEAHLKADGSGTVEWDGSWSVNFYGGMVPFTITDPVLTVGADGTGELTADLSGYASSMADPSQRSKLDPVADVVVSTFRDVELDPTGKVSIIPDYAGVTLQVPAGKAAQDTSGPGWGSWPQPFVDFHFASGLSSYWYSSGGAADVHKAPAAFEVDFTGAANGPAARAASTTTVAAAASRYGRPTAVRVRVAASQSGAPMPTGVVTVRVDGKRRTGTLASGVAKVALPPRLKPGKHLVRVGYAGDPATEASAGSTRVRIKKARPKVSLRLADGTVAATRRAMARVAAVIPGGRVAAVGKVVIRDGRKVVATARLTAAGRGRIAVQMPRLPRGEHRLTATLAGSAVQAAATSARRTLRVR